MKNNQTKFYWQKILGIFVIIGTTSTIPSAAIATPENSSNFLIAQVGVRSRINSPTPLNLRPRTHIPLPSSNRSSHYNRYRNYRYSKYQNDYYKKRQGRYHRHPRSDYDYDSYEYGHKDVHYRRNRNKDRRNRGSITIFF